MRSEPNVKIEKYRLGGPAGTNCGAFMISRAGKPDLRIIAGVGMGWDHVSVSTENRCPTWEETELVRTLFFRDDETVMQLSVPRAQHINFHPYCLHMWRPQTEDEIEAQKKEWLAHGEPWIDEFVRPQPIPLPPAIMVGPGDHA